MPELLDDPTVETDVVTEAEVSAALHTPTISERRQLDAAAQTAWHNANAYRESINGACDSENRTWTPDEEAQYSRLLSEMRRAQRDREAARMSVESSSSFTEVAGERSDRTGVSEEQYAEVFRKWAVGGPAALTADEQALMRDRAKLAQSTGTNASGGYLVPTTTMDEIIKAEKEYGSVEEVARVWRLSSGETQEFPTVDDTAQSGEDHAENAAATVGDFTLGQVPIATETIDSKKFEVSYELLTDSVVNVEALIGELAGMRVGRRQEDKFTNAAAATGKAGLMTNTTGGKAGAPHDIDVTGTAPAFILGGSGTNGAAGVRSVRTMRYAIDAAYRRSGRARLMAGDGLLAILMGALDGDNKPLWRFGDLVTGQPDRFDGLIVAENQSITTTPADNAALGAIGDFYRGYYIRFVDMMMLVRSERNMVDKFQVEFNLWEAHRLQRGRQEGLHPPHPERSRLISVAMATVVVNERLVTRFGIFEPSADPQEIPDELAAAYASWPTGLRCPITMVGAVENEEAIASPPAAGPLEAGGGGVCGRKVGKGECVLGDGHPGAHRRTKPGAGRG